MRRKIAKRLRREVLRMGAVIKEERWAEPKNVPRKENGYALRVVYRGWKIFSAGDDELESYRMVLDVMKHDCEEEWTRPIDGGNKDDEG